MGMSNNAVAAYDAGVKPLSKITVQDLRDAGLKITKTFAIWLAKEGHWHRAEWHHSGGTWYNEVDFYDPAELAEDIEDGDIDLKELEDAFKASKAKKDAPTAIKVKGTYKIWGGSRRRPRVIGEQEFVGELRGNWIVMQDGSKKKADGNHIEWDKM
tara:strand:- start:761 stop:1228 length:468 start_codon:yes stop_codon:yes gene_type:complete